MIDHFVNNEILLEHSEFTQYLSYYITVKAGTAKDGTRKRLYWERWHRECIYRESRHRGSRHRESGTPPAPPSTPLMTFSFGRSWGVLLWRGGKEEDREVDT